VRLLEPEIHFPLLHDGVSEGRRHRRGSRFIEAGLHPPAIRHRSVLPAQGILDRLFAAWDRSRRRCATNSMTTILDGGA